MASLLSHLLTNSAARVPAKEAVRFAGASLTYSEVEARSNQLASILRGAGVAPGDRVGIYLHKSPASVLGIFGVLKAGATYVPLDADAPAERVAYILRQCGVRVVVTASDMLPALLEARDYGQLLSTVVMTDNPAPSCSSVTGPIRVIPWTTVLAAEGRPGPPPGVVETDLAYVLYTSGSTGLPKGVMVSHRTIFAFIDWSITTFHMDAADRVTSHAAFHFDLSTFDLFVTMAVGATLVLVPEKLSTFPVHLVRLLQDERITVTYLVPSILSLMVRYGKLAHHDLSALRTVLFAGEVFPVKHLRGLVAALPQASHYNLYGPTETNVCTYYRVDSGDVAPERTQPVPIGRACEHCEVFVLDAQGQRITEPGREGELYVRGRCVARGYWGDPRQTRERFVRDRAPSRAGDDAIAYRTGDVVTLDADGHNWRYVGRRDHMVKSRGYRIELGEIETVLHSHESVQEAVAVAIPDELIGHRITAAVVPVAGDVMTTGEVRGFCRRRLPDYMVPDVVEILDVLPKTSTGKVNRPLLVDSIAGKTA